MQAQTMISRNTLSKKGGIFFKLPFQNGNFKLGIDTLNKFSDFRRPKHPYLLIQTRKISFVNELLTVGVIVGEEAEEMVYIKVKPLELLVSCSIDTDENYLGRYAYFALCHLMEPSGEYDFDGYYWPDFFDDKMQNKFLTTLKSKGDLKVILKTRYRGLCKPVKYLPVIKQGKIVIRDNTEIIPETLTTDDKLIGYCFLDTWSSKWHTDHVPFLISYTGVPSNDKMSVKWFNRYILKPQDLPVRELTTEQQKLKDICFLMKELAPIQCPKHKDSESRRLEIKKLNETNFSRVFTLWHEAFPLLQSRQYTHYHFTYGMRNIKGKPVKSGMSPCIFSNEQPELCFSWKEKSDYYKLELRFRIGNKLYELPYYFSSSFFVASCMNPRKIHLLSSFMDCEVLSLFGQTNYRMLFLKVHYEAYFSCFVDQLRDTYEFVDK